MATRTTTIGDMPIDDLLERAAELKGELVAFAQGPRFARRLDAVLFEAADDDGFLDEGTAILAMDYFLLQRRLSDGRTVLERFVAQRRPPLSDDEREMLLGWHDVVEGCFEVRRFDGDAVLLHNLFDDLVYSNMAGKGSPRSARARFSSGGPVTRHSQSPLPGRHHGRPHRPGEWSEAKQCGMRSEAVAGYRTAR
jgi:hypothetical protein